MAKKTQAELGLDGKGGKNGKVSRGEEAFKGRGSGELQQLVDLNFLEYAAYVIRDRAIPDIDDGLKPVQRRILWSLKRRDDGKLIKVANIVGYCMQFHPHGDASIADALVNLTNKGYLIEGQGNYGNVLTGMRAAASRYIECRLSELARNEMFDNEQTELIPSYDGRNDEPVVLPARIPVLLMHGADGIAVGLATRVLPHNFIELLENMILALRKQPLEFYPDFKQGGIMDVSEYDRGKGKVKVRAVIEKKDKSTLIIREIPYGTTTESLVASVENAARKKRIKIRSINDYTAENVEIHIVLSPGEDQDKARDALYALTDCQVSLNSNVLVLRDKRPVELTVDEVLKHNAFRLKDILEQALINRRDKLLDEFHHKTLVQIFVENRIYRDIEEKETYKKVQKAVLDGVNQFRDRLRRDVTMDDVEMLLGVRIKKISQFDIEKSKKEIGDILKEIAEIEKELKQVTRYTVRYIKGLIKTYADDFPRRTRIEAFEEIDVKNVISASLRVAYDKKSGYIGTNVRGGDVAFNCTALDKVVLVWRDGRYMVVPAPDKLFVNKDLEYAAIVDREKVFTLVYQAPNASYCKRFKFGGTIMNREYRLCPEKSRILMMTEEVHETLWVVYKPAPRQRINQQLFSVENFPVKGAKAKGNQLTVKKIANVGVKKPRNWNDDEDTPNVVLDI